MPNIYLTETFYFLLFVCLYFILVCLFLMLHSPFHSAVVTVLPGLLDSVTAKAHKRHAWPTGRRLVIVGKRSSFPIESFFLFILFSQKQIMYFFAKSIERRSRYVRLPRSQNFWITTNR